MSSDEEKGPGLLGGTVAAATGVGAIAGTSSLVHKRKIEKHPEVQAYRDKFKHPTKDSHTLIDEYAQKFDDLYDHEKPTGKKALEDWEKRKRAFIEKEINKAEKEPLVRDVTLGTHKIKENPVTDIEKQAKKEYEARKAKFDEIRASAKSEFAEQKPHPLQRYRNKLDDVDKRRREGPGTYTKEEWDKFSQSVKDRLQPQHDLLDAERDTILAKMEKAKKANAEHIRQWKVDKAEFVREKMRKSEFRKEYFEAERLVNAAENIGKGNKVSHPIAAFMGLSNGGKALTVGLGAVVAGALAVGFKKIRNAGSSGQDNDISR